jgi:hypothetical protein
MAAVEDVAHYQGPRLGNAADAAFAALDDHVFRLRDLPPESWRGASCIATNDTLETAVEADGYERELSVSIRVAGIRASTHREGHPRAPHQDAQAGRPVDARHGQGW